jgi:predicted ATPase
VEKLSEEGGVKSDMDRDAIAAVLRDLSAGRGAEGENREDALEYENMNRLIAAMTAPRSFDELEWELPPEARYLGPGVWMDAIRDAVRYGKK